MIVDTSAIMAIVKDEPTRARVEEALARAPICVMSAASRVELAAVLARSLTAGASRHAERVMSKARIELVPFDAAQAKIAADAYRDFGRGSGHPASLNMGDTFSYALAIARDEPLLFVGDGFIHTDVRPALPADPKA